MCSGIQEPRHERRGNNALPNPRLVSTTLSSATEQPDASRTLVVMQWSEFILHDLTYTPVRKMGKIFEQIILKFIFLLFFLADFTMHRSRFYPVPCPTSPLP